MLMVTVRTLGFFPVDGQKRYIDSVTRAAEKRQG
jgi:hypothetical protein